MNKHFQSIQNHSVMGNCEEELPKKPVGRQSTDRLRKKKNCVKNEQLT